MSRAIPIALQDTLDQTVSTVTRLLRIQLQDGRVFGSTMLDKMVIYDHGDSFGPVGYSAINGFDPSTISADTAYSVANAEGKMLVSMDDTGITEEMVDAGELDDAEWTCFIVNYMDPATGSAAILDAGDVGEVRVLDGMVLFIELLSYSMRYRQSVGDVWQRPCRAVYGSPRDSADGLGCGFDAEANWLDFEVTAVGAEANRTFTIDIDGTPAYPLSPARIIWETGDNAGERVRSVLTYNAGVVDMADSLAYVVQVGDTGQIRDECPHTPAACKLRDNYPNYNGEDHIPSGDAVAGSAPGAQVPGWSSGGGGVVPEEESE